MGIKVAFLEDEKTGADADLSKLTVKSSAVFKSSDLSYVYVYNSGVIEQREIKTGNSGNDITEIFSGLNAGDKIVDNPSNRLKDGVKVKVEK
jgi:HlyD family secretion protein